MKAKNFLIVSCRERERIKTADGENVFCKAFAKKLFMADLLSNGLHEKVISYIIVILLKVD